MQRRNRSLFGPPGENKPHNFFEHLHCSLLISPEYSLLMILRDGTKNPWKPCWLSDMRRVSKHCQVESSKEKLSSLAKSHYILRMCSSLLHNTANKIRKWYCPKNARKWVQALVQLKKKRNKWRKKTKLETEQLYPFSFALTGDTFRLCSNHLSFPHLLPEGGYWHQNHKRVWNYLYCGNILGNNILHLFCEQFVTTIPESTIPH